MFPEWRLFIDTLADPEIRSYSPYHKPLFLQYVSSIDGVNLRWSKYEMEDGELTQQIWHHLLKKGNISFDWPGFRRS